jgi:uncharacterized membrane protein
VRSAHGILLAVVAAACVAAVLGAVRLWPAAPPEVDAGVDPNVTLRDAELTAIEQTGTTDDPGLAPGAQALRVTARLADGRSVTFEMVDETGDTFAVGQQVRVAEAEGPDGGVTYYVNDIRRGRPLAVLAAIFLVSVVAFGRWQGVRALLGLALTLGVVVLFVVPAVLAGADPVAVALCAAVAIMVVTLYLTHGVRPKTTAAVVGTLLALTITVALSWLFIEVTALTGLADEDARMASLAVGGLSLRGLLLAGIIVGALGVLDDVTMAQASTVFELRRADPRASAGALFTGAMTVGRDHVGATINTLFLAYAGASLPLLILFSGSPDPLPVIASSEVVAIEIVRTLVGSIGLMASVPLTTALAAWLAGGAADDVDAAPPRPSRRQPRRDRRREGSGVPAGAPAFADVEDDDLEWERRLRESYGLHRRPDVPHDEGGR